MNKLDKLIESIVRKRLTHIIIYEADKKIINEKILAAKKYLSKLKSINEIDNPDNLTDLAYKTYRYITDAMFIVLRNPSLKKEFYKSLTDLQNSIEKYLFDYNKNLES